MSMPEQTDASKTSCFEESSSPVNAKLVVMKDSCFDAIETKKHENSESEKRKHFSILIVKVT